MKRVAGPVASDREWFSLGQLAALRLPDMPSTKRQMHAFAASAGWDGRVDSDGQSLMRKRAQRGGGREYHCSILPDRAQAEIVRTLKAVENSASRMADAACQAPMDDCEIGRGPSKKGKAFTYRIIRQGLATLPDAERRRFLTKLLAEEYRR